MQKNPIIPALALMMTMLPAAAQSREELKAELQMVNNEVRALWQAEESDPMAYVEHMKTLAQLEKKAETMPPRFLENILILTANTYERTGRPAEAMRDYQRMVDKFPGSPYTDQRKRKISRIESLLGRDAVPSVSVSGRGDVPKVKSSVAYVEASSNYPMDRASFPGSNDKYFVPECAVDGNTKTSWSPDRNYERGNKGEWIKVSFAGEKTLTDIAFINGTIGGNWDHNSRIKDAILEFSNGSQIMICLEDTKSKQSFELGSINTSSVKLIIDTVYPGAMHYYGGDKGAWGGELHEAGLAEIYFAFKGQPLPAFGKPFVKTALSLLIIVVLGGLILGVKLRIAHIKSTHERTPLN